MSMDVNERDRQRTAPAYRRYWGYYNRPYAGCGCFWLLLAILLFWWLLSLLYPAAGVWNRYWY